MRADARLTEERDWSQFHDPPSLILALVGEELADVLIYLIRLADVLGIDFASVAHRRLDQSLSCPQPSRHWTEQAVTTRVGGIPSAREVMSRTLRAAAGD